MIVTKFVCEDPCGDNIRMFDITDCANKCLGRPGRFDIASGNTLDMYLSAYTRFTLHCQLKTVHQCMNILTSTCMPLLILAASGPTDDFQMSSLGHIFGDFICSVAVD